METLIPVIATLLGGLLGFLASTYTNRQSNEFQRTNEQILFMRQEKEKLYFVVAKLNQHYRKIAGDCILKVTTNTEIKFKDVVDINLWDELSMITGLYFPNMNKSVKNLIIERDKVGDILGDVIIFKNTSQKSIQDMNKKILVSFDVIEKSFEIFQSEISKIDINE